MSLFNLKDIRYKKSESRKFTSVENNYSTDVLRYPIDLGNADKGHYMLIHINTQEKSSFTSNLDSDNLPAIFKSKDRVNVGGNLGNTFTGVGSFANRTVTNLRERVEAEEWFSDKLGTKVDTQTKVGRAALNLLSGAQQISEDRRLQFIRDIVGEAKGTITKNPLTNVNFLRTIRRTKDSIALYMPDTLAFSHNQTYGGLEMAGEPIATVGAVGSIISDFSQGKINEKQAFSNLTPFIGLAAKNALEKFGRNSVQAIFASAFGVVQNPMMELIYTKPNFRSFTFDFVFNPRSEQEATQVFNILRRLYFHQAPEISQGSAGYFLVPPSEFDIEFFYNGAINPNIPKISTCVLTNINVDYAPGSTGFSAYEVPGEDLPSPGRTGSPVSIRASLSFTETEIVTKADYIGGPV